MRTINLEGIRDKGRSHYRLTTELYDISYCYIRKNACSAFKNLFKNQTEKSRSSGFKSSLALMDSLYLVDKMSASHAKKRIVVVRDPEERFFSAVKNKLIQQKGHEDLFRDFYKKTGKNLNDAFFNEFLELYVFRYSLDELDPHFYSQLSHMHGIEYNCVIKIDELYDSMLKIIPTDLANSYFKIPSNSTDRKPLKFYQSAGLNKLTISELHSLFVRSGFMPNVDDLLDDRQSAMVREVYQMDYFLIG